MSEIIPEAWLSCCLTLAPEDAEAGANWLLEQGCLGVQVEDTTIAFDETEDAQLLAREDVLVTGYLRGEQVEALAMQGARRDFDGGLKVESLETRDWANEWRENFPPLHIGPFLVVPTWEEVPPSDRIVLRLDPGLAFGTGQHPTTHLCLELLAEELERAAGVRTLDVGCGSGILSVAAAKLGAVVTASDLDPWCVQATEENAALNEVRVRVVSAADLAWTTEPFPLVMANLMSDLLIRLAPELARVTAPGGTLIISGISAPRAAEVDRALQSAGFKGKAARELEGESRGDWVERWAAFVYLRVGSGD